MEQELKLHEAEYRFACIIWDNEPLTSGELAQADITMIPQTWVELTDEESIKKMNRLLDLLDADDDVQATYHNWDE